MTLEPETIRIASDSEIARLLEQVDTAPLRLETNGVIYRITREEERSDRYEPEKVRAALEATVGSWADLDTDKMIEDLYRAREEGSRPADRP